MRRWKALATGAVATLAIGAVPAVDPGVGDGGVSPFYRYAGALPDQPGRMLRMEPLHDARVTAAGMAMRILYSSRDASGLPGAGGGGAIAVSGMAFLPNGEPPPGGWPLVTWAHGTTGVADVCAPSWMGAAPRDGAYIDAWLRAGFAVVATDYQGLGTPGPHPYTDWRAEGRSVLDAARALLGAKKGAVRNAVVIVGQSQGSAAALGAAYLATRYANDLRVLATVATGVLWTVPDGLAKRVSGRVQVSGGTPDVRFTAIRMIGAGLRRGSPTPDDLMSAKGRPVLDAARHGCSHDIAKVAEDGQVDAGNAFSRPAAAIAALFRNTTDMPLGRIEAPVFLGAGRADVLIPAGRQYYAARAMCRLGDAVEWHSYAGAGHSGAVNLSMRDSLPFVRKLLAGERVRGNCSSMSAPGPIENPAADIPFNDVPRHD